MTRGITDFTEFYRRHAADVFRFALYLAHDRSDAEDITSETFVRVWAAAERVESTTVQNYLFTIARNLYRQTVRARARHVALDDTLPDPRADPAASAAARSEMDVVHERLLGLSAVDRTALLMRAVDGTPYDEIARALGISLASAKVKVHRARLALTDIR